jgi:Uma2 family endonuclease
MLDMAGPETIEHPEELPIRPLRRREYELLAEAGAFENEKVELLYGRIVQMSPQGTEHAFSITRLTKVLILALGDQATVRPQLPFAASEYSMPEPDLAVVAELRADAHPERALLVIEVAFSSLRIDRRIKARLYAETGIPEYWVVDVAHGEVIVHTVPSESGYRRIEHVGREAVLVPVELPMVKVRVADVLPPVG